jgi:hypothetical protein
MTLLIGKDSTNGPLINTSSATRIPQAENAAAEPKATPMHALCLEFNMTAEKPPHKARITINGKR